VTKISPRWDGDHRFGAVFAGQGGGTLVGMDDTNREIRVNDESASEQTDEARVQEAAVLTARLLANPRRVRRN
jgi:hypothetical protein